MTNILEAPPFYPPTPVPLQKPLGLLAFLWAVRKNPLTTWMERHFEEPIITGEGALSLMTVVNDPAMVRHVLLENAANYRKDQLQIRILSPGFGRGLVTAEGDEWKLQRRTLSPLFTPRTVTSFFPAMVESAEHLVRRWLRRPAGREIDIHLEMTRVTLDVLERTIFTQGVARDPDALGRAITRYFEGLGRIDPLDVFGVPNWVPRIGRWRAKPAIRFFEELVSELITSRKDMLGRGEHVPRDLMTLLLEAADPETGKGLSDPEVSANIVTFIGAGHETTANALTWTLYLLSQDERVRALVEKEVDEVLGEEPFEAHHLDKLVYTRAVLDETMRLYPPVPYMSRAAISDDQLGSVRVRAGSLVAIVPHLIHRHRALWDDPNAFRPERFLPEERGRIDRYAYLPFGAGPRVCIGASFALQEAMIIVATIVRKMRLDLRSGYEVDPLHRVTLRPRDGLPMRMTLRS